MNEPEIIEVSRYQPNERFFLGMLEEGVYICDVTTDPAGRLVSVNASPMVARCERHEGECALLPERGPVEDWLPRLPEPFKVAVGVRPRIECDGYPGCVRELGDTPGDQP